MSKPVVVVTGRNGQLGWEIEQFIATKETESSFLFADRTLLDLSQPDTIAPFFAVHRPDYFINCAAYTAVDKAERERSLAFTINATAVGVIAEQCKIYQCTLVTISTDYVFDGNGTSPYLTDTDTHPVNYYGLTKLEGELLAIKNNPKTIIIRTSWVYSAHGNNFVKTMLRLMKDRTEIKVVNDQLGCPTYAADLASAIISIIASLKKGNHHYGIYQYSNTGIISWYDFAVAIRDIAELNCTVLPIPGSDYPTPARRPAYSAMDIHEIERDFGVELCDWRNRLAHCIHTIKKGS